MDVTYWQKQGSEPLYSELEWNKPERRDQAGRVIIVGGSTHALNAPAKAYEHIKKQGIGEAKIALPEKTKKILGPTLLDAIFLPSTPSGELSQDGNEELLHSTQWADTVLCAGDVGRNSQTTILLESLLRSYAGNIVITKDAIDSMSNHPNALFERSNTVLVVSFSQLQRLIKNSGESKPLQFSMSLFQLVEYLHTFTERYPASITTLHENQIICAAGGQVSTTKIASNHPDPQPWRLHYASLASCYLTWNPEKQFQALTHSAAILAHELSRNLESL